MGAAFAVPRRDWSLRPDWALPGAVVAQRRLPLPVLYGSKQVSIYDAEAEGMLALLYNGECVGVQIPTTIELEITETDPAVKGDSATKRTKPATLQTGLIVQVPEYLKTGERIKVDSRTAQYISRA